MRIASTAIALLFVGGTAWAIWGVPHPELDWGSPTDATCSGLEVGALQCETVAAGFDRPLDLQGDGTGRTFVVEQGGTIRLLDFDQNPVWLNLMDRVNQCHHEQGLLGLAFSPDYANDTRAYVAYTDLASCDSEERFEKGDLIVARFDGREPDGTAEVQILKVPQPFRNHNGGHLRFGPDGMLYIGVGDGGDSYDPLKTGRDNSDLLGSILRVDVSGDTYTIPEDNPFIEDGAPEVYHFGLRNPWRFAFDDGMWITDVGQNCYEEINRAPVSGMDFGWSTFEGDHEMTVGRGCGPLRDEGATFPLYAYTHTSGGCSITGGEVTPSTWGPMAGKYLFSDWCTGTISTIDRTGQVDVLLETDLMPTSFGTDDEGTVYLIDWGGSVQVLSPNL